MEAMTTTAAQEQSRPVVLLAVRPEVREMVLSDATLDRLAELGEVVGTDGREWDDVELPAGVRAIVTGWGTPEVSAELLERLPDLEIVAHTGGSVRGIVSREVWERGARVTTAAETNNRFVAEYTAAQVLLALKGAHHVVAHGRRNHALPRPIGAPGTLGQRIGLVSYGSIARHVRAVLRALDVEIWTWDPYVSDEDLARDDVRRAADLDELFRTCLVVSIHSPLIPGVTEGLVGADQLALLRPGATLVNTSRGAIIDEPALVALLQQRPDVCAVLDVTWPEPPVPESPLWELPNVQLTGHVAGAIGSEAVALGAAAVEELERHLTGEPLRHEVSATAAARRA